MQASETERELLVRLVDCKKRMEALEAEFKEASKQVEKSEIALLEHMTRREVKSTARYEGIGWATLEKPELYARCAAADKEKLIAHLEVVGRADIVKPSIHHKSLTAYVKELLNEGKPVPEMVSYGFVQNVLTYAG